DFFDEDCQAADGGVAQLFGDVRQLYSHSAGVGDCSGEGLDGGVLGPDDLAQRITGHDAPSSWSPGGSSSRSLRRASSMIDRMLSSESRLRPCTRRAIVRSSGVSSWAGPASSRAISSSSKK